MRTFIPGILKVADYLKKYVFEHSTVLKERMGDGLYALLVLVIDLVVIVASLINAGHTPGDQWSDFNGYATLTASTINEVQAAIDKFYASLGIAP